MSGILELKNITKIYPGVRALDDVSISFEPGEVHAIMGENGAGKSTLIKVVAGAIQPTAGEILVDGHKVENMAPRSALDMGISVVYQELSLAPGLSVAENIFMGQKLGGKVFQDFNKMRSRTGELFGRFGLEVDPDASINSLSTAQQQLVEISKAISRDVRILILDEPSSTLATAEVEIMMNMVRKLKAEGICVIYISHRMEEVFEIADRVTVLRDGKYIATKPIGELTRQQLISLMVGRELVETYPPHRPYTDEVVLDVKNVSGNGVENVSFQVHKGEIFGLAGLVGAGRTELAKVLYGAEKLTGGEIVCYGKGMRFRSTSDAINAQIGLIPEDRKGEGVFLDFPIDWNITINSIRNLSCHGFVDKKKIEETTDKYFDMLRIKAPSQKSLVRNLSGGNQQKVALAKTLASDSSILIFDEPTRGIDVGAKQEIYKLMAELADAGISIIMISSEMEELLGMSDRILVMCEKHMVDILEKDQFSQEYILTLASGLKEDMAS